MTDVKDKHHLTVSSTGRTVVTALGGAAALGLLTAAALPAIPVAAVIAAGIGLLGGGLAAKFDKSGGGK